MHLHHVFHLGHSQRQAHVKQYLDKQQPLFVAHNNLHSTTRLTCSRLGQDRRRHDILV